MLPMLIGAGAGMALGAIGSLFSDESEQTVASKALLNKIRQIQGYSRAEINNSVNQYDRAGRTALADTMNNYAIGSASKQGMMNAAVAKMVPTISMLGANRANQMLDYNKNLEVQKLQMEGGAIGGLDSDSAQDDFFSIIGMGLQGAQLGNTIANAPTPSTIDPVTTGGVTETPSGFLNNNWNPSELNNDKYFSTPINEMQGGNIGLTPMQRMSLLSSNMNNSITSTAKKITGKNPVMKFNPNRLFNYTF